MWRLDADPQLARAARLLGGSVGRFLYRWGNLSLRVIAPGAYGDRSRLTPAIHRQYLDRFPDRWSRGAVLWPLAKALLGSSAYYDSLWERRSRLQGRPALIVWGMKDTAFRPHPLERWREVLPEAQVVELANSGHWPHEEEPDRVIADVRAFLADGLP